MSAKTWKPGLQAITKTWDFDTHGGAVGTINLGNLPTGFVVTHVYASAVTAPVGGGTLVVGEDNSGDADGYFTDLDALAVATPLIGTGALVSSTPHKVVSTYDGVLVTIGTTAYTAGKIDFVFIGFQS